MTRIRLPARLESNDMAGGLVRRSACHGGRAAQRGHGLVAAALRHHSTRAAFAAAALSGYAQLELNGIKTHASVGAAGNVTVRNTVANTDDHGGVQGRWREVVSINTNLSHLQPLSECVYEKIIFHSCLGLSGKGLSHF